MNNEKVNVTTVQLQVNGAASPSTWARWTTVAKIVGASQGKFPFVAAMYNNNVVSLDSAAGINGTLYGLTAESLHGWRVLQRSYSFLLAMAVHRLYPESEFRVQHSIGAGLYCSLELRITNYELRILIERLEAEMMRLAERDLPIVIVADGYAETIRHFEASGQADKLNLLRHQNSPVVELLWCDGFCDLHQGALVNRTGLLRHFKLIPYENGFVLQMPAQASPVELPEFKPQPHLVKVYREHSEWGRTLGIQTVGQLNEAVYAKRIGDLVQMSEGLHVKTLARIADAICARKPAVRLVLLAGPSSAGKTTSAKRLVTHLRINGLQPLMLSTDDYFTTADKYPLDEQGKPDYEHLEAVDLAALNADLTALMGGEPIRRRIFDFKAKSPAYTGETLTLGAEGVIVIEGLHGLNPRLTEQVPRDRKFLVYLSALTQLGMDNNNRISTTDNRLIRRIVRDNQFRGHDALKTLRMWPAVRRGEERWVFPFQELADATFNSSLDYELAVLKTFVEPLLMDIKPDVPEYADARRLMGFLRNFYAISAEQVPNDSLLREFIGGSLLQY